MPLPSKMPLSVLVLEIFSKSGAETRFLQLTLDIIATYVYELASVACAVV